ncbi:MAG: DUF5060 domain-containing protein, partial [Candidatus Hydrogenedentes bacterium]|nr:DUF5060 domain-containing protein [Candidatus Hydrogenedentota bacterium]
MPRLLAVSTWGLLILAASAEGEGSLATFGDRHNVLRLSEFRVSGVPSAANPFDPDEIAVDVVFGTPSGRQLRVPAFWYEPYRRALEDGKEELLREAGGEWRLRFTPEEVGEYRWELVWGGAARASGEFQVEAETEAGAADGFIEAPPGKEGYFQRRAGKPFLLIGENCCWHGARGTYDYDDWFAKFAGNHMNFARIWMWPAAFGIEVRPEERLQYNLADAWRLDYVFRLAQDKKIALMLCLDFHGMFQVEPDMWGGNNHWPRHPYNAAQGGPCAAQNDFFTHPEAKQLYQKRLRYLVARYGAFSNLLSWEFFNEINNVYKYLNAPDVVAWHAEMAAWMKTHDPYRHCISTSFGSAFASREMWALPGMDFAQYHSYLNWEVGRKQPVTLAREVVHRFDTFQKSVLISEFGTSGLGLDKENDPYSRGLRQALWAGALSGTAGTAMPWFWESIHHAELYGLWKSLGDFLAPVDFAEGEWRPLEIT